MPAFRLGVPFGHMLSCALVLWVSVVRTVSAFVRWVFRCWSYARLLVLSPVVFAVVRGLILCARLCSLSLSCQSLRLGIAGSC